MRLPCRFRSAEAVFLLFAVHLRRFEEYRDAKSCVSTENYKLKYGSNI